MSRWLILALGGGVLLPAHAVAGPWTMPDGKGRVIATGVYSHAGESFDSDGHARPAADYDQYQLYLLGEYGITDELTAFTNVDIGRVAVEGGPPSSGVGFVELGARYRLLATSRFTLSAQASGIVPGRTRRDQVAQIGNTALQYDVRAQGGYGFSLAGHDGFASAEGGYRWRDGIEPNEWHGDVTVGLHLTPRLTIIANDYNTWSDGAGRMGYPRYRYSNGYAGAVYDVNARISLQLGGLATVAGANALRERGVFAGVWLRF